MTNLGGVLFDMDGVLLDTEPLYTVAYDRLMAPHGARLDRDTKLEIMGRPAILSAAHVIQKFALPMTPEEFLEMRKPILAELFAHSPAMPGAEDFVRALSNRGHRLAVATSTHRALFELKTQKHSWFSLFDVVVCGDDEEIENPKPAPDIFLLAARRLGVTAQHSALFEDSPSGARAAVATNGRVFVLVREPVDAALYPGAHRIIEAFTDVRFTNDGIE